MESREDDESQERAEYSDFEIWEMETGGARRFFVEDLEPQKEDR